MTRILTQLDKDAALAELRELAPAERNARLFQSTFDGQIDPQRLVIGYRFGWFAPPVRLAIFSGRVRETGAGTEIRGDISSGWIIYVLVGWLVLATPLSFYRYAADGDYPSVLFALLIAAGLFYLGRAFVRYTQEYVVGEIGRAVRGKVIEN